ncbi:MAG: helix-turn-helix domain-containing protein [Cypionkella sp.]
MSQALATITLSGRQTPHNGYFPEEHFLPRHQAANMLALPSWKFILALVALKHGVLQRDILGVYRDKPLVAARHEAIALIYQHTLLRVSTIGRHFDRDHATVLFILRKMGATTKLVCRPVEPQKVQSPRVAAMMAKLVRRPNGTFAPKAKEPPLSPLPTTIDCAPLTPPWVGRDFSFLQGVNRTD